MHRKIVRPPPALLLHRFQLQAVTHAAALFRCYCLAESAMFSDLPEHAARSWKACCFKDSTCIHACLLPLLFVLSKLIASILGAFFLRMQSTYQGDAKCCGAFGSRRCFRAGLSANSVWTSAGCSISSNRSLTARTALFSRGI